MTCEIIDCEKEARFRISSGSGRKQFVVCSACVFDVLSSSIKGVNQQTSYIKITSFPGCEECRFNRNEIIRSVGNIADTEYVKALDEKGLAFPFAWQVPLKNGIYDKKNT